MAEYKIVVLGAGGVGKSALSIRFIQGKFVEKYDPTIEDSYRKQVDVDGQAVMLDILDTAGQEEYAAMREPYMQSGQGFVLVYSIIDHNSFDEVSAMYDTLVSVKGTKDIPIVLVGNKADLEADRVVEKDDALKLIESKATGVTFLEASAKDNLNVDQVFLEVVRSIMRKSGQANGATETTAAANGGEQGATQGQTQKQEEPKKKKKKGCLIL
eukprot:ANDGO_00220.mRNA.1 Ras-related protein Rap-1